MIMMLWRGGIRVQEALALSEHDLDPRRTPMRNFPKRSQVVLICAGPRVQ
jgi:hypothetical protein